MSAEVMRTVGTRWSDAEEFKRTVRAWADRIKVRPARIQVQAMSKKWASCSAAGTVSFSADLLQMDREFGEAVIVHELVHLKIPNHGKLFWSLVRSYAKGHLADVSEERSGTRSAGTTGNANRIESQ